MEGVTVRKVILWSDSTTALHWIRGDVNRYKQFVRNVVNKINKKSCGIFRHVPGELNPADIASRGAKASTLTSDWWNGPRWLQHEREWPEDVITTATRETESESKVIKQIMNSTIEQSSENSFILLIDKFNLKKTLRVTAWVKRFCNNVRNRRQQRKGPLTTEEIETATHQWIVWTQADAERDPKFPNLKNQLNIQKDNRGLYVCVGRVQGHYPVYLPSKSLFTEKLLMDAHRMTLHGGVGLTMTSL